MFRQPTDVVKALLLGPPGTTVRLGFHRGTDPRAPLIQVALHRQTPGETLVGVGIIFRSDSSGALFVRQLQHGSPAQQSGQVHIGDCIVEVNGVDVFRKPISSFTKLMLGPPGTIVQLGFKRASSQMIEKVSLRRSIPAAGASDSDPNLVVSENNIQLRRDVEKAKDEHLRLKGILEQKRDSLKEVERMYERGASSMGGQMNDELQRFKTFHQWPHSESSHPGVTPAILAAEGFHFCPTAQDPDTVICFFCDLQVWGVACATVTGVLRPSTRDHLRGGGVVPCGRACKRRAGRRGHVSTCVPAPCVARVCARACVSVALLSVAAAVQPSCQEARAAGERERERERERVSEGTLPAFGH